MTTHISPHDHDRNHDRDHDHDGESGQSGGSAAAGPPMRVSGPEGLLTALPAMLGFVPDDSLVTILLGGSHGRSMVAVARHDLAELRGPAPRRTVIAEQVGRVCAQEQVTAVLMVVVDPRWRFGTDDRWQREVVEDLAWTLAADGVGLRDALLCTRIAAGAEWIGLGDDRCGRLSDPRQSAMAAAHVYQGRTLYDSREEMAQILAPGVVDPAVAAGLASLPVPPADPDPADETERRRDRAAVERLCRLLAAGTEIGDLPADDLVRIAADVLRPDVRDSLLGLAVGPLAAGAERFWAEATRALPAPWRAETAALFAFTAYARGEGPPAGVGVETALAARPGHRLATLLSEALGSGMHPDRIRELAEVGIACAQDLGVRLP